MTSRNPFPSPELADVLVKAADATTGLIGKLSRLRGIEADLQAVDRFEAKATTSTGAASPVCLRRLQRRRRAAVEGQSSKRSNPPSMVEKVSDVVAGS